jgi:hypothetical protein
MLEMAVDRLQADMSEVKSALMRVEPRLSEMFGAFQHLATKAQVSEMSGALRADPARRPTVAGIIAIVGVIAAIAAVPVWGAWLGAIRAIVSAGH